MSGQEWTEEELVEFDRLVELNGSPVQMDRIEARLEMSKIGWEKCRAMWEYLQARDCAAEDQR